MDRYITRDRTKDDISPFQEGVDAAKGGWGWDYCPYTDNYRYTQWMGGWDSVPKRGLPVWPQMYETSLDYNAKDVQ